MPRLVALGAHGSYMMIRKGHGGAWGLGHYPLIRTVVEMMRDKFGGFEHVKVRRPSRSCRASIQEHMMGLAQAPAS